jgi:hypothetical protein
MVQALVALTAALAFAFFLIGMVHAFMPNGVQRWQLWTANPLTVSLGYWVYRRIMESALPYEYIGYFCWFYLSIAGSILFAVIAYLGSRAVAPFVRVR